MNNKQFKALNIGKSNIKANKECERFEIVNVNNNLRHQIYNEEYIEAIADTILEELGCKIKTELSSRVKGKSKLVLKIESEFIECDESNVTIAIQEAIGNNTNLPEIVRNHTFITSSLFSNFEYNENGIKIYKGNLRSNKKVYTYDFMRDQRWGFNESNKEPRLTVCYDGVKLGLCLRYTIGEKEEVTTLSSYLSMYQRLP
jgi:hypothetical protein